MDLSNNNLRDLKIKENLKSLGNLKDIDLSKIIKKKMKEQFASLGKLEVLDFSHNNFNGVLFKEIFQLGLVVWQLLGIYVADVLLEEKQNRSVTLDCFYYLHTFYALTSKMET